MKILAIEFSSTTRSVAAGDSTRSSDADPAGYAEAVDDPQADPFALIEDCLSAAGWSPAHVEGAVVGLGPGSFTGIRTAIAMAQGWQLGRDIPFAGLGTMDVLARQLIWEKVSGPALLAVPAQRHEFHVRECRIVQDRVASEGPLTLMTREALERRAREGRPVYGPGMPARLDGATDLYPSARALWQCACDWPAFPSDTVWQPIELRRAAFVKAPPAKRW